jgi:hypothetical protein
MAGTHHPSHEAEDALIGDCALSMFVEKRRQADGDVRSLKRRGYWQSCGLWPAMLKALAKGNEIQSLH